MCEFFCSKAMATHDERFDDSPDSGRQTLMESATDTSDNEQKKASNGDLSDGVDTAVELDPQSEHDEPSNNNGKSKTNGRPRPISAIIKVEVPQDSADSAIFLAEKFLRQLTGEEWVTLARDNITRFRSAIYLAVLTSNVGVQKELLDGGNRTSTVQELLNDMTEAEWDELAASNTKNVREALNRLIPKCDVMIQNQDAVNDAAVQQGLFDIEGPEKLLTDIHRSLHPDEFLNLARANRDHFAAALREISMPKDVGVSSGARLRDNTVQKETFDGGDPNVELSRLLKGLNPEQWAKLVDSHADAISDAQKRLRPTRDTGVSPANSRLSDAFTQKGIFENSVKHELAADMLDELADDDWLGLVAKRRDQVQKALDTLRLPTEVGLQTEAPQVDEASEKRLFESDGGSRDEVLGEIFSDMNQAEWNDLVKLNRDRIDSLLREINQPRDVEASCDFAFSDFTAQKNEYENQAEKQATVDKMLDSLSHEEWLNMMRSRLGAMQDLLREVCPRADVHVQASKSDNCQDSVTQKELFDGAEKSRELSNMLTDLDANNWAELMKNHAEKVRAAHLQLHPQVETGTSVHCVLTDSATEKELFDGTDKSEELGRMFADATDDELEAIANSHAGRLRAALLKITPTNDQQISTNLDLTDFTTQKELLDGDLDGQSGKQRSIHHKANAEWRRREDPLVSQKHLVTEDGHHKLVTVKNLSLFSANLKCELDANETEELLPDIITVEAKVTQQENCVDAPESVKESRQVDGTRTKLVFHKRDRENKYLTSIVADVPDECFDWLEAAASYFNVDDPRDSSVNLFEELPAVVVPKEWRDTGLAAVVSSSDADAQKDLFDGVTRVQALQDLLENLPQEEWDLLTQKNSDRLRSAQCRLALRTETYCATSLSSTDSWTQKALLAEEEGDRAVAIENVLNGLNANDWNAIVRSRLPDVRAALLATCPTSEASTSTCVKHEDAVLQKSDYDGEEQKQAFLTELAGSLGENELRAILEKKQDQIRDLMHSIAGQHSVALQTLSGACDAVNQKDLFDGVERSQLVSGLLAEMNEAEMEHVAKRHSERINAAQARLSPKVEATTTIGVLFDDFAAQKAAYESEAEKLKYVNDLLDGISSTNWLEIVSGRRTEASGALAKLKAADLVEKDAQTEPIDTAAIDILDSLNDEALAKVLRTRADRLAPTLRQLTDRASVMTQTDDALNAVSDMLPSLADEDLVRLVAGHTEKLKQAIRKAAAAIDSNIQTEPLDQVAASIIDQLSDDSLSQLMRDRADRLAAALNKTKDHGEIASQTECFSDAILDAIPSLDDEQLEKIAARHSKRLQQATRRAVAAADIGLQTEPLSEAIAGMIDDINEESLSKLLRDRTQRMAPKLRELTDRVDCASETASLSEAIAEILPTLSEDELRKITAMPCEKLKQVIRNAGDSAEAEVQTESIEQVAAELLSTLTPEALQNAIANQLEKVKAAVEALRKSAEAQLNIETQTDEFEAMVDKALANMTADALDSIVRSNLDSVKNSVRRATATADSNEQAEVDDSTYINALSDASLGDLQNMIRDRLRKAHLALDKVVDGTALSAESASQTDGSALLLNGGNISEPELMRLLESHADQVANCLAAHRLASGATSDATVLTDPVVLDSGTTASCDKAVYARPDRRTVGVFCYIPPKDQRTLRVSEPPAMHTVAEMSEIEPRRASSTLTEATINMTLSSQRDGTEGGLLLTVNSVKSQMLTPDGLTPLNLSFTDSGSQQYLARESLQHADGFDCYGSIRGKKSGSAQTEHFFDNSVRPNPDSKLLSYTEQGKYIVSYVVKQVYNLQKQKWRSVEKAEAEGVFRSATSSVVNNLTNDCMALEDAIRNNLVRVEPVERGYSEDAHQIKVTRVRLRKYLPAPFHITSVLNRKTGECVSYWEALNQRLLHDTVQYVDNTDGHEIPLLDAIKQELVRIEFLPPSMSMMDDDFDLHSEKDLPLSYAQRLLAQVSGLPTSPRSRASSVSSPRGKSKSNLPEDGSIVQVYAVHKVIDSATNEAYSFDAALRRGLINQQTGRYIKPSGDGAQQQKSEISFEDAMKTGLIHAVPINSA